jgi:hypothetical protein
LFDNKLTKSILSSYINIFNLKNILYDFYALKREILLSISDSSRILYLISILNLQNIFPFKYIAKVRNQFFEQNICVYELYNTYNTSMKEISNLTDYLLSYNSNWIQPSTVEKIINDIDIKNKMDDKIKRILIEELMINYSLKKEKDNNKEKEENYFIKIEIESLDMKSSKKKEAKAKSGNDEKMKEEKKREEEDYFMYQIDEYLCKIVDFFNNKQIEKLINEKPILKKILLFLSKYKRSNFIEFLKRTNINKYIQFFTNYFKPYDPEIYNLAKKVHRNFHIQFNKEYFSNQVTNK